MRSTASAPASSRSIDDPGGVAARATWEPPAEPDDTDDTDDTGDGADPGGPGALTADLAERLLADQPLVSALSGSIPDMKVLRDRCLGAGIPAIVGRQDCGSGACGSGGGCGPKASLLIHATSVPALGELLHGDWRAQLEREGLPAVALDVSGDELPCPACGTAAPLVGGCCSDCGLRLE